MAFAGQAEFDLRKLSPAVSTILAGTDSLQKTAVYIAFINLIAYYVHPSLRNRLLMYESDNKSIAQRFRDALNIDRTIYKNAAYKVLLDASILDYTTTTTILEVVSPTTNVITGE